jgi:hypothetical protein
VSAPRASRPPVSAAAPRRGDEAVRVVAANGVRKSVWLVVAALALAAMALFAVALFSRGERGVGPAPEPPPVARPEAPPAAAGEEPRAPARSVRARRIPATPPDAPASRADESPAREDPIVGFGPPGEKTGMALFPPMGSKPIKIGIVVPEEFEVPEGYVKHYQATEDGELLPAILLFHPDYEWVDETGAAIEMPADRVVPPSLAPPGLPIRLLEPPQAEGGAR